MRIFVRLLLKQRLTMWLRTIVLACLMSQVLSDAENSANIAVVGAGVSGIAAASKLLQNGFENIILLEAEDRLGGRINTVPFGDYVVDLGAEWVHGEVGNVAYELAAPHGLLDTETEQIHYAMYESSGEKLDPGMSQNLTAFFIRMLTDIQELIKDKDKSESICTVFKNQYETFFAEHPEIATRLHKPIIWHYNLMQTAMDAADDWCNASIKGYEEFKDSEGNHLINWKERGYSTILDVLMKKIPNPEEELPLRNKTMLSTEVATIDYSGNDKVKIKTIDGKEHVVDHVIVTPSLGVMKAQHQTLFDPPLPENKIKSIEGIEFGTALKMMVSFDEPWWENSDDLSGFVILWNKEDKDKLINDPEKNWFLYVMGFWPVKHKPHLLEGWVSGDGGRKVETLPEDKFLKQTISLLHQIFSNHFNITQPTGIIKSGWYNNKHFRGTYSYRSVATEKADASADDLAEPIMKGGKPMVLFAGEATNRYRHSTVHGAIETGWREADRLIEHYKKKD